MRRHSLGRSSSLQSLFRTPWPMTPHVRESHCHLLLKGKSRKRNGFERLNRLTSLEKQGQTLAVSADEEAKVWGKTVQTIPAEHGYGLSSMEQLTLCFTMLTCNSGGRRVTPALSVEKANPHLIFMFELLQSGPRPEKVQPAP